MANKLKDKKFKEHKRKQKKERRKREGDRQDRGTKRDRRSFLFFSHIFVRIPI